MTRLKHSITATITGDVIDITYAGEVEIQTVLTHHCATREFTQQDAPADDEPKKSRNEHDHAILSQALARI